MMLSGTAPEMAPAGGPADRRDAVRLLVLDPDSGAVDHRRFTDLPAVLRPGDLVVVNDAGTLPASLAGRTRGGAPLELRLVAHPAPSTWTVAILGAGDWRQRTEHRPAPPLLGVGARVTAAGFSATVVRRHPVSPRLVDVRFDLPEPAVWSRIYRCGRPIQYSHLATDLDLWSVQTLFAGAPWAVEAPSAGLPLSWSVLAALRARGVGVAALTHAAGLSATGDAAIDAALPLPERFRVPMETVHAVRTARRVFAVGTTVVRALESAARGGVITPEEGWTDLRIDATHRLRVVDGLLTGMHAAGESHRRLMEAFAPADALESAWREAVERGYRGHEFGDVMVVLPGARAPRGRRSDQGRSSAERTATHDDVQASPDTPRIDSRVRASPSTTSGDPATKA
jgi:S-adenosylmethionine:tRNA ribosyltransferase-isomerase